ncbi:MAG: hypothetical protein LBJ96_00915 [Holosporaceae bacterium]|nr:hypothetical protein [Holosporaceae bacterium]
MEAITREKGLAVGKNEKIVLVVKNAFQIPLPGSTPVPAPVKMTRELLPEDLGSTDDITIYKIDEIKIHRDKHKVHFH